MKNCKPRSIGNDLVDLNERKNDTIFQVENYLQRIISPEENLIFKPPGICIRKWLWLLWSLKEASYKYEKRFYSEFTFSPKSLKVQSISECKDSGSSLFLTGTDFFNGIKAGGIRSVIKTKYSSLIGISFVTNELVYSIVYRSEKDEKDILWGIMKSDSEEYNAQSTGVRTFALNSIGQIYPQIDIAPIRFIKNEFSVPAMVVNQQSDIIAVSFSHDSYYLAFAILGTGLLH